MAAKVMLQMFNRLLTPDEILYISNQMFSYMTNQGAEGHPLFHFLSHAKLYKWIEEMDMTGNLEVWGCGDTIAGILGYIVAEPPWSDRKVLREMTMFTIDQRFTGLSRILVKRLEELAIEHDCSMIETGDALNNNPAITRNIYMRKGKFDYSYPSYVKILS